MARKKQEYTVVLPFSAKFKTDKEVVDYTPGDIIKLAEKEAQAVKDHLEIVE